MGTCESQNDNSNTGYNNIKSRRILSKQDDRERNEQDKVSDKGSNGKGLRERKLHISHNAKEEDRVIANIFKPICDIKFETASGTITGHGFLLGFWVEQEKFNCLMTNDNLIPKKLFNDNIDLYLSYDKGAKSAKINLKDGKRYKRSYLEKGLDITIVEIIEEDEIQKEYFLSPESRNLITDDLTKSPVYIPKILSNKDCMHIRSEIKEVNNYEFTLSDVDKDLIGNPIFLGDSINVIGILKEINDNNQIKADFIHPVVHLIKELISRDRNYGKYFRGPQRKYVWEDGKYYLGEFKNSNNLPNGKGIKYNKDGTILYEGDFVNGRFEGKGRYNYPNGRFFIGEYKKGLRNGKGIIYYPDGKVNFESNYVDDKREGEGKFVLEDGSYYIGNWENGLFNGKGKEYYPNGKLRYEGDYVDGKREGKGKYIWRDGDYYIGEEKNDLRHGKGTQYDSSGAIIHRGKWVDDEFVETSTVESEKNEKNEKSENDNSEKIIH